MPSQRVELSGVGKLVRRHDPDRFLTALFAPAPARETLFVLYAFNHELARAREAVREPMMALIRLQWWREVLDGARPAHEVATPLGAALDAGRLDPADLLPLIDAREAEATEITSLSEWCHYILHSAGGLAVAAGRSLGAAGPALDAIRGYGAAYGAAGTLRSAPLLAHQARTVLPPGIPSETLAAQGRAWLDDAARIAIPRPTLAAALPATLARRDLRRLGQPIRPRGVADRLAVLSAWLRGRP